MSNYTKGDNFTYLHPTENSMVTGRSAFKTPTSERVFLGATEQSKKKEQVSYAHAFIGRVRLGAANPTKSPAPAMRPISEPKDIEIWVEMARARRDQALRI